MKLVTFEKDGRSAVGLLNAAGTAVHPVPGCTDMQALIGIWPVLDTAAVLRGEALPLERVRLLAPIPRPVQDVICAAVYTKKSWAFQARKWTVSQRRPSLREQPMMYSRFRW